MSDIGVILAGGRSSRMGGGHKFLRTIGQERIIDWVVGRLRPQVDVLIASAAADATPFDIDLTTVHDLVADAGPLAGMHACADWAARAIGRQARIVTVPADTPFIPLDLVARLSSACVDDPAGIGVAASSSGTHHAVASWPAAVAEELRQWLAESKNRSIRAFLATQKMRIVEFDGEVDPFLNVNTSADLERAGQLMGDIV